MANQRRREKKTQQRLHAQDHAREKIALSVDLKNQVNARLREIKNTEGVDGLQSPDLELLFTRANHDALVDVLAAAGALDRSNYNIARYGTILEGLTRRAQSRQSERPEAIAS